MTDGIGSDGLIRAEFREERKLELERRKFWVSVFALMISIGSVVTLYVAYRQYQRSSEIYLDDLDTRLNIQWRDNIKVLLDNPKIVDVFVSRKELPSDASDRALALTFADLRLEVIDQILNSLDAWDEQEILTWKATFLGAFKESSVLCERYKVTKNRFDNIESDLSSERISHDISESGRTAKTEQEGGLIAIKFVDLTRGLEGVCGN